MDILKPSAHVAESGETIPPLFIVLGAGSGDKNAETVSNKLAEIFYAANQPYELFLCLHPGDIAEMTRLSSWQVIVMAWWSQQAGMALFGMLRRQYWLSACLSV